MSLSSGISPELQGRDRAAPEPGRWVRRPAPRKSPRPPGLARFPQGGRTRWHGSQVPFLSCVSSSGNHRLCPSNLHASSFSPAPAAPAATPSKDTDASPRAAPVDAKATRQRSARRSCALRCPDAARFLRAVTAQVRSPRRCGHPAGAATPQVLPPRRCGHRGRKLVSDCRGEAAEQGEPG